jgi:hypothetical protein
VQLAGQHVEQHVSRGDQEQLPIAPDEKAGAAATRNDNLHRVGKIVFRKIGLRVCQDDERGRRKQGSRSREEQPSCHGAI